MSKQPQINSPLLTLNEHGHAIGKNPLDVEVNLLKDAEHTQMSLAKVMRKKCLDCSGFQPAEVKKCVATDCALWPYRMGKSPFRSHMAKESSKKVKNNAE